MPDWLKPNKMSSLSKADQEQRRKLQKQLYKLEEAYSKTTTKREGQEIWNEIVDIKEELRELLAMPPQHSPQASTATTTQT